MIRFAAGVMPVALVLLSLPGTKRGVYLLPALPLFAAALGAWIASTNVAGPASGIERWTLRACAALWTPLVSALRSFALPLARLLERAGAAALGARLATASAELLERSRAEARGAAPARALSQLAWTAYAAALLANVLLRAPGDPGRDLGPLASEVSALAQGGRALVAFELAEEMRGALPFYTGKIVPNLHGAEALRRFAREEPGGLVLQGNQPLHGFPQQFLELRELRTWPMAEGAYRVYEVAPSQEGSRRVESRGREGPA
jgi:hypothetical protein